MAGELRPQGHTWRGRGHNSRALTRIVEDQEFRATLTDYGVVPIGGRSAAFQQFLMEDARAWAQVVKASNITVD